MKKANPRADQRHHAFLEFLPDPVFILTMDSTVVYLNPAFEKTFGWTLEELSGQRIPFIPENEKDDTRIGMTQLFTQKVLHGFETRRMTKSGRVLDVLVDAAVSTDDDNNPVGQIVFFRDVTARKRAELTNQTLFRIARALYRFPKLDSMLDYITFQVQTLFRVAGALVILVDEKKKEFYIPAATYEDGKTAQKMKTIRFPVGEGIAGQVFRNGKPLIVPDTTKSHVFFHSINEMAKYHHNNMLDVPLCIQERVIGVLCAVNKKEGDFDQKDVDLLTAVANFVALPIENARVNESLAREYQNVRGLNRTKELVIHNLSHELKTPISVLYASLALLEKRYPGKPPPSWDRIMDRARRNLKRLLDLQYEIGDMLRKGDFQ